MRVSKLVLPILFLLLITGCISPKTYIDPSFADATYDDVLPVTKKYKTQVLVEFQRNGELFSRANKEVRGHVERTLRATGVVEITDEDPDASIKVVVNNIADLSDAALKGFGTGLTFGASGSLVSDYYEITIEFDDGKGTQLTERYKHALHTTIGNKKAPFDNVQPTTPADAFASVIEETILNFIKDTQSKGLLSSEAYWRYQYSLLTARGDG